MEKVTEELVRQNGNQAAAVMADYAGQGGGGSTGGGSKGVYGSLVDLLDLPCFKPLNEWPEVEQLHLSDILADGYASVHWMFEDASTINGGFYVVKVTGSNPSVSIVGGRPVFTDCETVNPDLPDWIAFRFAFIQAIRTVVLDDLSKDDPLIQGFSAIDKESLTELGYLDDFVDGPLLIGEVNDGDDYHICVYTGVSIMKPGPR